MHDSNKQNNCENYKGVGKTMGEETDESYLARLTRLRRAEVTFDLGYIEMEKKELERQVQAAYWQGTVMQSPSEGRKEKSQPETVARRKRDLKKAGFEIAREIEVREKKKEERRNRKK